MTNQEIITKEAVKLATQGKIGTTGNKIYVETGFGVELVDEPVAIHTYAIWQKLGYQVKKGQKAVAKFRIWKPLTKKAEIEKVDGSKEEIETTNMTKVNAAFFSIEQVEKIA